MTFLLKLISGVLFVLIPLTFNSDGTIVKVKPTLRGVGITDARMKIQIDRYSAISKEGVSVSFVNDENKFEGWKCRLEK